MNQSTVAERFNAASESLELKGHRVIVRRARFLLEGGNADEAVTFLEDAGHRMRGLGIDGLAADLRSWRDAGGDPGSLVTDPEWVKGAAADHLRSRVINQLTHGASMEGLVATLADQNRALASGAPLSGPPARRVAPDKLPPLPRKATDGKKSLGDVFARAAVEAPSRLEEREMDLGLPAEVSAEEEAVVVEVERTPPPAATSDDVLKLVSNPAEDFPVVPPARVTSSQPEPQAAPEVEEAPIELAPVPPAPTDVQAPPAEKGKSGAWVIGLLVLAALAAGIYFATRG